MLKKAMPVTWEAYFNGSDRLHEQRQRSGIYLHPADARSLECARSGLSSSPLRVTRHSCTRTGMRADGNLPRHKCGRAWILGNNRTVLCRHELYGLGGYMVGLDERGPTSGRGAHAGLHALRLRRCGTGNEPRGEIDDSIAFLAWVDRTKQPESPGRTCIGR